MGYATACPVEMDGDTTLEGVGDNPGAVRYRDASGQKGERQSTNPRVPGLRGAIPIVANRMVFRSWSVPVRDNSELSHRQKHTGDRRPQTGE